MSKCLLSKPLLHFIFSLSSCLRFKLPLLFFPSSDLAHCPLCWLNFIQLLSCALSSLLSSVLNNLSIRLPFISLFFMLCFISCLSFVFAEISAFCQSLFSLPTIPFPSISVSSLPPLSLSFL